MNLNMNNLKISLAALAAGAAFSTQAFAQSNAVSTPVVGFVSTTIAAGTVSGPTPTFIAPVLTAAPEVTGNLAGTIATVSSNSVTVTSAGWTSNTLSSAQAYLYITSGSQAGLILQVSSNTADTVTLETFGINISTAGVATGDAFKLVVGESILSFFGTTADGVLGGTAAQFAARQTDTVSVVDSLGVVRTYYYNTDVNQWRRTGSSANQGSIAISPTSGAIYFRKATSTLPLLQTGTVPATNVKYIVPGTGTIFLSRFFPTDGTLASFGLQNLPGWNTTTDKLVAVDALGVVRTYFWNGTQWRRTGSSADQGTVVLPAGSAAYTFRPGTGAAQILNVVVPYTL